LRTVINNTNDETKEIKARYLTTNNKVNKTLIKTALCYSSVTWTLTQITEQMLCTFERKIRE